MQSNEIYCVMQSREHAQTQQVELHQARRSTVVFVPLQHTALMHSGPLNRAHLTDWAVAYDHAPRVHTKVSGVVKQLCS